MPRRRAHGRSGNRAASLTFGLFLAFLSLAPSASAQAVYGSIARDRQGLLGGRRARRHGHRHKRRAQDSRYGRVERVGILRQGAPAAGDLRGRRPSSRASRPAVLREVRVSIDTQTRIDFELELGQLSEEVVVTGGSPLLKTDRADVSTNFDSKQITDLPVLDRNFTKFILLTPGTQQLQWQHAASENPQGSTQTMVNGQHFSGTGYQLDGTENRDPDPGHHRHQPHARVDWRNEDHLAELRRGIRPGDRGRRVGADQVRAGTSGSAARSSSIRATTFSRATRSRSSSANPVTGKFLPETKKNQFGGSVGGKIVANKVFFFGDYQGTRSTVGGTRLLTVPTAAARSGDLSAFGINIFDPLDGRAGRAAAVCGQRHPDQPAVSGGAADPRARSACRTRRAATAARRDNYQSHRARRSSRRTRSTCGSTGASATARTCLAATASASSSATAPRLSAQGAGRSS